MFYCEACQERTGWPQSLSRSSGRCEVCEEAGLCYDVPSGALPDPKPQERPTVWDRLNED